MSKSAPVIGVLVVYNLAAAGIHEGLLVDAPDALDRAHIEGVLATQIAWMGCFYFSAGQVIFTLSLQGRHLRFSENGASLGDLSFQV